MKTIIIGGSGFVGSFLIKELQNFNIQNIDTLFFIKNHLKNRKFLVLTVKKS